MIYQEEHLELQRSVKKFVENEINPHVEEWEEAGIFPAHELFAKMGKQGWLGINKPEEYGGLGLDYTFQLAFAEAIGNIQCGSLPMAIGVQTDMATPALAAHGSDELRKEFLAPAIAGEQVACIGVSEPGAGSDVAAIRTTAKRDGDDYVINGGKMWITNGTQADWMCMLAVTGDSNESPWKNKSLIVVPMDSDGITVARKLDKLGMRSSDTAQLFFENVRVPVRYRIGEEGMGFILQMLQFQEERLWGAATSMTGMDRAIEATIEYTRERKTFGQPIIDNQAVHFRLAELKTEVEALRSMVYRAGRDYADGNDVTMLASMAKLKGGRLMREVTDSCLQYYGGMGFMNETPITRAFRDGRLMSIGGGADEIMLGIICKFMDILPSRRKS